MNYTIFNDELNLIKNERLKESCIELLKLLPDYFYHVEASSSGKYHPAFALGEGGLVRHTKVAVKMADEIIKTESVGNVFTQDEKDMLCSYFDELLMLKKENYKEFIKVA